MKFFLFLLSALGLPLLSQAEINPEAFLVAAEKEFGVEGKEAAQFLIEGIPESDRKALDNNFLLKNHRLAFKARQEFSWAKTLPKEIFFNDVLPYASLDETREFWRADYYRQCSALVKDCKSATEAAQVLNRDFFNLINVHYNKKRKAPNQSPAESQEIGKATCTGLSIIFVDACRSIGVPARVAGTALWSNKRGNHTWSEIYDGGEWHFTGADEYNEEGLNRGWFTKDAGKAIADDWKHAIWATSWKKTDAHFPMVWDLKNKNVPAVNVTTRYAQEQKSETSKIFVRLWDKQGGQRIIGNISLLDANGKVIQTVTSKAGTHDLNDMPELKVTESKAQHLVITHGEENRSLKLEKITPGETLDLYWEMLDVADSYIKALTTWLALLPEERHLSIPEMPLSADDSDLAMQIIGVKIQEQLFEERKAEVEKRIVKAAGKEMKYLERVFGEKPNTGRSLYISMHGGGGAPARVNDQQWQNQIKLYTPKEGIYVAPRAPTNSWNLWHESHIDALFDRLIENMVITRGVNPDKVYLMGYSAGGDGVYQLAPRMADRYAAAAMMAGHPNGANPIGLRNLPFAIFMGENDGAYKRNQIAEKWGDKLDQLQEGDPEGYDHRINIYKGLGHWMERKDAEVLPWMAKRARNTWPKKLVWYQSGRTHNRFSWLAIPEGTAKQGQTVRAEVVKQSITINASDMNQLNLRLHDFLIDLDQEITVIVNEKEIFKGKVQRTTKAVYDSILERFDPLSAASAILELKF